MEKALKLKELRSYLKNIICEILDEERISNRAAAEEVRARKNFVGSHTYGEDIGSLGRLYVAYSYGEQHPLYLWDGENDMWYYNHDDYILPDGTANIWTKKHLQYLRPTSSVHGRPGSFLKKKIELFKQQNGISDEENAHTDLHPGEK